jgi:hypothetical protein
MLALMHLAMIFSSSLLVHSRRAIGQ